MVYKRQELLTEIATVLAEIRHRCTSEFKEEGYKFSEYCAHDNCNECWEEFLDKILKPANENYILDQLQQMLTELKAEVRQ